MKISDGYKKEQKYNVLCEENKECGLLFELENQRVEILSKLEPKELEHFQNLINYIYISENKVEAYEIRTEVGTNG